MTPSPEGATPTPNPESAQTGAEAGNMDQAQTQEGEGAVLAPYPERMPIDAVPGGMRVTTIHAGNIEQKLAE